MTVIFDTDILSAFAKADALLPLKKLFSKHDIYITPEIYEELSIPVDYGYTFPLRIFEEFEILTKEDVKKLISEIEKKDNTRIKDVQKIL